MDFRAAALDELATGTAAAGRAQAFVGFDGFVDSIVTPVGLRTGPGEQFEAIPTISAFAQRIAAAAGKSTNLEFYPRLDKLGGNGPIMANALLALGNTVRYVGALGRPEVHPILRDFAQRTDAVTLCAPAHTTAVEFDDGKLMLGTMASFAELTYARLVEVMGADALRAALARADLVALVNWTMLPHMTAILEELADRVFPQLPPRPRVFFFDLADPEKRTAPDLRAALGTIARFEKYGRTILGLNLKEAQQVHRLLGGDAQPETEAGVRETARTIRALLEIAVVVVHPTKSAACATRDGTAWVPGPYAEKPLLTTGAGDHFNAGFATGQLLGLSPTASLTIGVATSGLYVRSGRSPSLAEIRAFLQTWGRT